MVVTSTGAQVTRTSPCNLLTYDFINSRNWNAGWALTGGASTSPCADDYKGLAAADAPETKGLAAFLDARARSSAGAKMYVDWHSYSQLFMFREYFI